jgi:hypothetical protein
MALLFVEATFVNEMEKKKQEEDKEDEEGKKKKKKKEYLAEVGLSMAEYASLRGDFEVDVDSAERELMTQRDEVTGAFSGQDSGNSGRSQRVPLGQSTGGYQRDHFSGGAHNAGCDGSARGDCLVRDIDHSGGTAIVEV